MANTLLFPQSTISPAHGKGQGGLFDVQSLDAEGMISDREEMLPIPNLIGDITSSLHATDSRRSFDAADAIDMPGIKRPRFDSLTGRRCKHVEVEDAMFNGVPPENSYHSSFEGIHHRWTDPEVFTA